MARALRLKDWGRYNLSHRFGLRPIDSLSQMKGNDDERSYKRETDDRTSVAPKLPWHQYGSFCNGVFCRVGR
jgi:hypothetical protein